MVDIVLATHNENKRREIETLLKDLPFRVKSLKDFPMIAEIVEDGNSFAENAGIKARAVSAVTGCLALADDSGLEVRALNGAPGIFSARFAGMEHNDAANNSYLLEKMSNIPLEERQARFVCVLALALPHQNPIFLRGELLGVILHQAAGSEGFGYDPLFFVQERLKTLAQMAPKEKNSISHRGRAFEKALPLLEIYAKTGRIPPDLGEQLV